MSYKTTYILFGILIAIMLAVSLSWWFEPVYEDTARFLFPSANGKTSNIAPEDVVKVVIDRKRPEAGALVFKRDDESKAWTIVEPRPLRADSTRVDSLVSQTLRAVVEDRVDAPRDLKAAELEPPAETITLTTKDGKELKLSTGAESPLGSDAVVYLDSSEKPDKPIPVLKRSISSLFQPLTSYRDSHLLASAVADYQKVALSMSGADKKDESKGPLELTKHTEDGLWEYKDPSGYDGLAEAGDANAPLEATKPPAGVDALLRDLSDLRVESGEKESDWVEDAPKDMDKYGLDPAKSDVLTLQIDRVLGVKGEQKAAITLRVALGKKTDDKKYFAAVSDDKHGTSVVKIATAIPDAIALLFKDPNLSLLRSRRLVALDVRQPLAVTVKNDAGVFQLLREKGGEHWKLYRGDDSREEEPVDGSAADLFVNQLMQDGQVRDFLDPNSDKAKLGLDKPAAEISIYVEGVQPKQEWLTPCLKLDAEKSKNPAAQLKFGAVDGNLIALLREANHAGWSDKPTLVKAPKEIGEMAKRGLLHYRDKTLPRFSLDGQEVVGLKVVRVHNWSINEYVLFRYNLLPVLTASAKSWLDSDLGQGPLLTAASVLVPGKSLPDQDNLNSPWQFLKPDDYHNAKVDAEQVDRGVLGTLLNLKANSLVAEKPSAEELEKYGLKPAALTVELTKEVGGKTETYTYSFGTEAPDGGVYARQSQREMVFEVGKEVVSLLNEDLRDRTVFAFDPAKVKTLSMSGWQKTGRLLTDDLKRNDDKTWTVTTPGLTMNFDRFNRFFTDLTNLKAERFIPANSPIKAQFDQEKPKFAFTVTMTVEGVVSPCKLEVVDLTGDLALPPEDRQVYAMTSTWPGQIFQAPRAIFTTPVAPPPGPIDDAGFFSSAKP